MDDINCKSCLSPCLFAVTSIGKYDNWRFGRLKTRDI